MTLNFKKTLYIGCIPLWAEPNHPTDQSPCIIQECPTCSEKMWVSQKKRDHQDSHENVEIHCLKCIALSAHEQGYELDIQNIAEMQ